MTARAAVAVSALPAILLASGCGRVVADSAKDFSGDKKAVATAVEDLQSAGKQRDATKICDDLLAAPVVRKIEQAGGKRCSKALKKSLDDADTFELTVKSVTITGTRATAVVASDNGRKKDRTDTLTLVKEGPRWKILSLGQ